jgi:hypothetical protein
MSSDLKDSCADAECNSNSAKLILPNFKIEEMGEFIIIKTSYILDRKNNGYYNCVAYRKSDIWSVSLATDYEYNNKIQINDDYIIHEKRDGEKTDLKSIYSEIMMCLTNEKNKLL